MNPDYEKEPKNGAAIFWRGLLLNPGTSPSEWSFKVSLGGTTFCVRIALVQELSSSLNKDKTYEANYTLETNAKFSNAGLYYQNCRFQICGNIDEVLLQVQLRNPELMSQLHDGNLLKEILESNNIYQFLKDYIYAENESQSPNS